MDDATVPIEKQRSVDALRRHLQTAKHLRRQANSEPAAAHNRLRLRDWQAGRLARTHADLLASQRFGEAARFFLSDLYGPKDFSSRDEEVERILPLLIKMLPASALRTVALAVELDALSEELDSAMVAELDRKGLIEGIDEDTYAAAYRSIGCRAEREQQIVLIRQTGEALDRLARKPLLSTMLKLMRGPAHLAGLGDLHEFLDRGFNAFRGMGSAAPFLDSIERKEQQLLGKLFAGIGQPFSDGDAYTL
ncbi:MAG: hypothetical protein JNK99_17150 [Candidatus Accumulibacter sp.]|uniref:FFLEELY motif protein n=1 Tax=Accumulibacter sp. TaxID=2053492 RepID=UPI001A622D76|nr:hypothetical protein [Accumulibacter sp.]MBL8396444.1 hypothetical protein [Accumulibacter sp.]